jgi:nucleoid-associated protein YgaU
VTFTQPSVAASSPVAEAEAALSRTLPPEPSTDTLIASQPTGTISPTVSSMTALLPNQTNPATQPTYQRAEIAPRYENAYTDAAPPLSSTSTPRIGEMYTVPAGETYWTICEKVYGTGRLYQALAQHNRSIVSDPRQLQGATIEIPSREVLERYTVTTVPTTGAAQLSSYGSVNDSRAATPQPNTSVSANWASSFLSPSSNAPIANRQQNVIIYIVQEGDDLFSIAQNKLGSVAKYTEIYEMNRDKIDATNNTIRPGTELILPTSGVYRGTQRR